MKNLKTISVLIGLIFFSHIVSAEVTVFPMWWYSLGADVTEVSMVDDYLAVSSKAKYVYVFNTKEMAKCKLWKGNCTSTDTNCEEDKSKITTLGCEFDADCPITCPKPCRSHFCNPDKLCEESPALDCPNDRIHRNATPFDLFNKSENDTILVLEHAIGAYVTTHYLTSDKLVVGATNNRVYLFGFSEGAWGVDENWYNGKKLSTGMKVNSVYLLSDRVFAGTDNGRVQILNVNGSEIATIDTGSDKPITSIDGSGNMILVAVGPNLIAYSTTGDEIWRNAYERDINSISTTNVYIVVGADKLYLLNRNGEEIWSKKIGSETTAVRVSAEYVVGGSKEGYIYIYNMDGSQRGEKYETDGTINSISISKDREYVVVGSSDGKLYVLNKNCILIWSYMTGAVVRGVDISGDFVGAGVIKDPCGAGIYTFNSIPGISLGYIDEFKIFLGDVNKVLPSGVEFDLTRAEECLEKANESFNAGDYESVPDWTKQGKESIADGVEELMDITRSGIDAINSANYEGLKDVELERREDIELEKKEKIYEELPKALERTEEVAWTEAREREDRFIDAINLLSETKKYFEKEDYVNAVQTAVWSKKKLDELFEEDIASADENINKINASTKGAMKIDKAKGHIREAKMSLQKNDYAQTIGNIAIIDKDFEEQINKSIEEAHEFMAEAKTVPLASVTGIQSKIDLANANIEEGNYGKAFELVEEAKVVAQQAKTYAYFKIMIIIAVVLVLVYFIYRHFTKRGEE